MHQFRVAATVTATDLGYKDILEEVAKIDNSYVLVGFQEGTITKYQTKGNRVKKPGFNMAQIAAANEFGYGNTPARPFMRTSFDENQQLINRNIEKEYDKIIEGKSTVKKSLGLLGILMERLIVKKIRQIRFPPNSPRTIAAKKSDKPLIDFGQMVSSVQSKAVIQ